MMKQKKTIQDLVKKTSRPMTINGRSYKMVNANITVDYYVYEEATIDIDMLMDISNEMNIDGPIDEKSINLLFAMSDGNYDDYDEWKTDFSITNRETNNFYKFIKNKISIDIHRSHGPSSIMINERYKTFSDFLRKDEICERIYKLTHIGDIVK